MLLFDFIETFSEYTVTEGLADHGVRINLFDEIEDILAFVLAAEYHYHFDIFLAVPAFAMQNRNAPFHLCVDGIGNGLVAFRDNHELNGLPVSVENIVEHDACNYREYNTIDNEFGAVEQEVTGADNGNVDELHDAAHTQTTVFIDHCHNDVCAAGRSVVRKNDTYTGTA